MFGGRDCPLFRNKFPLVQRLRVHYPFLLDIIHQIEAKVLVRRENNTVFQFLLWNPGAFSQSLATTVTAIRVQSHLIYLVHKERRAIGHTGNRHLLSLWFGDIHRINNA